MNSKTSIRTIAEEAGVSHMSVSLALRNDKRVSLATRERIQQIADRLRYRPDPMVARVMSTLRHSSDGGNVIVFVTKLRNDAGWEKHHVFGRVVESARDRLQQVGYKLETIALDQGNLSGNRLSKILYARGIKGIICMPMKTRFAHLSLDFSNISSVLLGPGILRPALHRVLNHQYHTMMLALRKLKQMGNRRIGMAMLQKDTLGLDHYWNAGFLTFGQMFPGFTVPAFVPKAWDQGMFNKWFKKHRPDAIVSLGLDYVPWLADLGAGIPNDVQVALLDLVPGETRYAGIDQNHNVAGSIAADLLLGQIYFNDVGIPKYTRTILVDGTWVDGPSAVKRKQIRA